MESVRKDIECVFALLKGRFRALKLPILFQKQSEIDNMFATCVILHNMLLRNDGLDNLWEKGVRWDYEDGQLIENDEEWELSAVLSSRIDNELRTISNPNHNAMMYQCYHNHQLQLVNVRRNKRGLPPLDIEDVEENIPNSDFHNMRRKLVNHFSYQLKNKKVEWINHKNNKIS